MRSPSKIATPNAIITRLPAANVTPWALTERRLCAKPLIDATRLCQDKEERNAPETKRIASMGECEKSVPTPKMSVVKYVTVRGLRRVNPRTIPYVCGQLEPVTRDLFSDPDDFLPRYSNQAPKMINPNALTTRRTDAKGDRIEIKNVPATTATEA
jgi:hypothetical protein